MHGGHLTVTLMLGFFGNPVKQLAGKSREKSCSQNVPLGCRGPCVPRGRADLLIMSTWEVVDPTCNGVTKSRKAKNGEI